MIQVASETGRHAAGLSAHLSTTWKRMVFIRTKSEAVHFTNLTVVATDPASELRDELHSTDVPSRDAEASL